MAVATPQTTTRAEFFRSRRYIIDWWTVISLLVAALLVLLVVSPLTYLIYTSFKVPGNKPGFTLLNYVEALTKPQYLKPMWNTFRLGAMVGVLAVLFGAPLAWAVSRTDMPGRRAARLLGYASFVLPSFLGAVAYVFLMGPNAGFLNKLWVAIFGVEQGPFNAFSLYTLAFVLSLYTFPYVFVLTTNALDAVSSEMEEAAYILGAPWWKTALKITLPLVLPAVLGGAILACLESMALFGPAAILAIPGRTHVMTTQIWVNFGNPPPRVELSAAFAMPLLLATMLMLAMQRRVLGRRGYATLTGKAGSKRIIRLGPWRWALAAWALLVATCSLFLPFGLLAIASISGRWFAPLKVLTLEHYTGVFTTFFTPLKNTVIFGGSAATVGVLMAFVVAYLVNRRPNLWHRFLAYVSTAPAVVPGIIMAIGLFAAYARPPLRLYGTPYILIAAYLARFLPIAFTNADAAIKSVHPELEEAARILGSSRVGTLARITMPLIKGGLTSGWFLTFIPSLRELSATLLLFTASTKVVPVAIYDLYEESRFEALAAMGLVLIALTLLAVVLAQKLVGRDIVATRE